MTRLPRSEYQRYIKSPEWAAKKAAYRASKLPQVCHICGATPVDLHHRGYSRLGCERLNDLLPLCREHHVEAHRRLREELAAGANPGKVNTWTITKILKREARKDERRSRRTAAAHNT